LSQAALWPSGVAIFVGLFMAFATFAWLKLINGLNGGIVLFCYQGLTIIAASTSKLDHRASHRRG
jgi:hypothetical protein